MGCRGMKGPIGQGLHETWWQKVKRKVYNRFWPWSEKILDLISSRKKCTHGQDSGDIGVKGTRGPS